MAAPIPKLAEKLAENAHAGQKYDDAAYVNHTRQVVGVLERFGIVDPVCICAGYCHDTIEDTTTSYNDIKAELGEEVAEVVFAVSSELGRDRKERNKRTYPKIKGNLRATVVKLADRIANIEHGAARGGKTAMYRAEYPDFKAAIYVDFGSDADAAIVARMWAHLDQLMKG